MGSVGDGSSPSQEENWTYLRSSKEYLLTEMSAKSPPGFGRGALGLGRVNMSCGERMSGDDLRVNSAGMVVSGGLARGCWTERPRRCRNHMSMGPAHTTELEITTRTGSESKSSLGERYINRSSTPRPSPRPPAPLQISSYPLSA